MKTSTKSDNLKFLQEEINIRFKNTDLLKNAFIHRSYINEHPTYKGDSNERLEFLGDSVLSLFVSTHIYNQLPKSPEGELTQIRASLVRTETLAKLARNLSLGQHLFLSKGEEESGGRSNKSILANTFEALIGAIYLDQGDKAIQIFIKENILNNWQELAKNAVSDNKSKLQEKMQKKFHKSPIYKLAKAWGPDHDRRFEIDVFMGDKVLGRGIGKNKQTATQNAARDALTRLKA